MATIVGPAGSRDVHGTPRADVIYLRRGNSVHAGAGNDLICGHGLNFIWGDRGDDRIIGSTHDNSRLFGGPGDDRIRSNGAGLVGGGGGDDTVVHTAGGLFMRSEKGHDTVTNRSDGGLAFNLRHSPVGVEVDLGGRTQSIRDQVGSPCTSAPPPASGSSARRTTT